ncbi:hypothetical protein LCGC14_0856810 [marine sediment metagenome]|uniref:Uncharacterized protein n=1 Tax=marine sediment metagenome TaxID=412755 RepID=A0A0F9P8G3_9ZZZZ
MSKSKAKVAEVAQTPDRTKSMSSRIKSSGAVLGEFLKGQPHYPVFCINPDYGTDSENDRWTLIIPLEGTIQAVKTEFRGYTPKSDLSSMALAMMSNPDRAVDATTDLPVITDTQAVKLIGITVAQL